MKKKIFMFIWRLLVKKAERKLNADFLEVSVLMMAKNGHMFRKKIMKDGLIVTRI